MNENAPNPHPSQRALARSVKLPLVSGKTSVFVLLASFGMTALLIVPVAGRFPPWVDVEIVLGIWWLVWLVSLSYFLYTGRRISDDHALGKPRWWFSSGGVKERPGSSRISPDLAAPTGAVEPVEAASKRKPAQSSSGWNLLDGLDVGGDLEGCLVLLAILLAVGLLVIGIWLLIEIVIPALAFLGYYLVRGMLARVANDQHGCEENLVRSVGWGTLWASVYIVPQAALVWFIHMIQVSAHP